MTGLGDLRLSRNDLRAILLSGEIRGVMHNPHAMNCSRCGRPYSEHAHSADEAKVLRGKGRTKGLLHAFRTQNDVGLWLTGRRFGGLLYEPDGKWDSNG